MLEKLLARARRYGHREALVWRGLSTSYEMLAIDVDAWRPWLQEHGIGAGSVVHLDADVSPRAVSLLLALLRERCIVAITTGLPAVKRDELRELCQAEALLSLDAADELTSTFFTERADHPLIKQLRDADQPGLVIFSSGSTGKSKAAVHSAEPLLKKFNKPGRTTRVLAFLLLDHIGGFNTLLYTFFNGGTVIVGDDRTPDAVAASIARHRAEALTTTPTFLRLLLLSQAHQRHDLSSLQIINYGTEVMPEATLEALRAVFPSVRLSQAYGLTEVGVLPVRSQSSGSLFISFSEDGTQTRVRDGLLEVKSQSMMLGYLNAVAPFTEDGWFKTGDAVEMQGEHFRIVGRASDLINVGGQKVYPAQIETVLEAIPGVAAAAVSGAPHPFTGQIVKASVTLTTGETTSAFVARMRAHCRDLLPAYMIPQKVELTSGPQHGVRFKKMRA